MTSRERVCAALGHKAADRIPVDFGGSAVTGIHVSCVAALRDYYGLEKRPVKVHEPYQMLGLVEDDLQQAMGIDVTGVFPRNTMFGFPVEDWKPWNFNGLEVLVPGKFEITLDANGDVLIYPEGDRTVPPSGRMPNGGQFFDSIIRQKPIDEDALNPEDNLEEFKPMSEADLAHLGRSAAAARATGRAVLASFGGTAFGDIALVPGPFLKDPRASATSLSGTFPPAAGGPMSTPSSRSSARWRWRISRRCMPWWATTWTPCSPAARTSVRRHRPSVR